MDDSLRWSFPMSSSLWAYHDTLILSKFKKKKKKNSNHIEMEQSQQLYLNNLNLTFLVSC